MMMIQEILTYLILLATMLITINKVFKFFKNSESACSGCASSSGCKIAALKDQRKSAR